MGQARIKKLKLLNPQEDGFIAEQNPSATKESIEAAAEAFAAIKDRPFYGRNPHLGKMINCPFCDLRHRENERKCEQKFAEKDGIVYGALVPLGGLTQLTKRQIFGARAFAKKRQRPRNKPNTKMTKWARVLMAAAEKRKNAKTV
jgi:hypothetical protein